MRGTRSTSCSTRTSRSRRRCWSRRPVTNPTRSTSSTRRSCIATAAASPSSSGRTAPSLRLHSANAPNSRLSPRDEGFSNADDRRARAGASSAAGMPSVAILVQVGEQREPATRSSRKIAKNLLVAARCRAAGARRADLAGHQPRDAAAATAQSPGRAIARPTTWRRSIVDDAPGGSRAARRRALIGCSSGSTTSMEQRTPVHRRCRARAAHTARGAAGAGAGGAQRTRRCASAAARSTTSSPAATGPRT